MKVGIVGNASRTVAWEAHLRPHGIVQQVDLSPSLKDLGDSDACLILNDTPEGLDILLDGVRRGLNCFLVSPPPTDKDKLDKIHRASRESGVHVQFSHWPTLAPATQWMIDKMHKPHFFNIAKEVGRNQLAKPGEEFRNLWIDELGFCLKWADSGIHHIEAKEIKFTEHNPISMHLFIRFENGSSASVYVYVGASENKHIRTIFTKQEVFECNVPSQTIRIGRLNEGNHLFFNKQSFDPSTAAEKAALLFLKSIQLNINTAYTSYDALQLATQVERVEQRLKQF